MNKLIQLAYQEIGTKEISGSSDNPRIVNYAQESGFNHIKNDETPWCSIFMNWLAKKVGLEYSGKANARSWLYVGTAITDPEPGDIVIFWREDPNSRKGHVGIFMGYSQDKSRIYTLGGNQGNMVSESAYPAYQVLGFRRLRSTKDIKFSNKVLKRGDIGNEVIELQDALKMVGCNPGTSDGIFGPKTENALKCYQANHSHLKITGKFDRATQKQLASQLSN